MENTNLIEVFGKIIKASRDTGLDIVANYKNKVELPKCPDEEQKALMELVEQLDAQQIEQLQKGIKYCIELSLFKFINSMENGISQYSFDLSIEGYGKKEILVGKGSDCDISLEYWNWIG